ncbi:hypothetical protein V6N13_097746 [Hibiscus sabdariffa]
MQIASLGKARRQGGSSITFVQHGGIGTDSSLESEYRCSPIGTGTVSLWYRYLNMGIGTDMHWYRYLYMGIGTDSLWVVYRSWTFGFDSGIPRVTISGRFCDWTGSRGLHLLVSEPGYAIIGTVSEGNEETLPPPPVGGEVNVGGAGLRGSAGPQVAQGPVMGDMTPLIQAIARAFQTAMAGVQVDAQPQSEGNGLLLGRICSWDGVESRGLPTRVSGSSSGKRPANWDRDSAKRHKNQRYHSGPRIRGGATWESAGVMRTPVGTARREGI